MHREISYILILTGVIVVMYGFYMPAKAMVSQWLIQDAWSKSKLSGEQIKPWSWMDSRPVMRLSSVEHNKKLVVLSGDSGNVLAFAPGHNTASYLPGQGGTVLVSAHRDTHFSFLQKIDIGNRFIAELPYDDKSHIYEVKDIKVINSQVQDIEISDIDSELKLVSCYPFNATESGGSLRYVVTANLVLNQKD